MIIVNENNSKNNIIVLKEEGVVGRLIVFLILLSFFFSQFYFWSSGFPQFSHIFILSAIFLFFIKNIEIDIKKSKNIILLVSYISCVNFFWCLINFDYSYISSTIYWIFNLFFFLLMISLNQSQQNFIFEKILLIIPFSYILEISIWMIGLGRHNFEPRYNGLFNDPNQMAFWVLSTCAIFLYISKNSFNKILIYFLALFLILLTLSRSASLGFLVLSLGFILSQKGNMNKRIILFFAYLLFLGTLSYFLYLYGYFDSIVTRFFEGLEQKNNQVEGRGFFYFLDHPQYLIFGTGQGGYGLYNSTGSEIHSTWFGVLFYYGVIGFSLFLFFIYQIFNKLSFSNKMIFLGPMVYGFTTYNARTLIFWFLLSTFFLFSNNNKEK